MCTQLASVIFFAKGGLDIGSGRARNERYLAAEPKPAPKPPIEAGIEKSSGTGRLGGDVCGNTDGLGGSIADPKLPVHLVEVLATKVFVRPTGRK